MTRSEFVRRVNSEFFWSSELCHFLADAMGLTDEPDAHISDVGTVKMSPRCWDMLRAALGVKDGEQVHIIDAARRVVKERDDLAGLVGELRSGASSQTLHVAIARAEKAERDRDAAVAAREQLRASYEKRIAAIRDEVL